jgi:hypothetical protein
MISKTIIALTAFTLSAYAAESLAFGLDGEEIFSIQDEPVKQVAVPVPVVPTPLPVIEQPKPQKVSKPRKEKKHEPAEPAGNLPTEFVKRDQRVLLKTTSATIIPAGNLKGKLKGLRTGDIAFATILHSIIAFPNEAAPVIAQINDGPFKGARLLGASRLEPNSKRIFIDFKAITTQGETYDLLASAVTEEGQTGFSGEYHSNEAGLFTGDFIASFTAAYFDGLVPRNTNVFGTVVEDYSPGSAIKKGMAGGAMATAERFREKLKRVPEFSELKGPINVGLLIVTPGDRK